MTECQNVVLLVKKLKMNLNSIGETNPKELDKIFAENARRFSNENITKTIEKATSLPLPKAKNSDTKSMLLN
jgi:hypothetical protein